MSRLHEALSQAGMKSPTVDAVVTPPAGTLEDFPLVSSPAEPRTVADAPADRGVEQTSESRSFIPARPKILERLVINPSADQYAVEQYRRIAAVLHQTQVDRGIRVVMVASAQAAEGKTLTAANLGLTLSESYKRRVLLIDADLRRPSLSSLFQLPNASGLAESLKASRERPLNLTKLSDLLTLLPGGRPDPDPMAGLTSGRMQQIIEQAAENFEWVIIDTPPVALLTDTRLLVAMVDVAVLVIDAGSTPCGLVERAIESIGRDKLLGVVLNRVDRDALQDNGYYNYYYSDGRQRAAAAQALPEPSK